MSKSQQGYCSIQAKLFVPLLSPPWSRFSSALPLSSLLLGLGYLQAYVHAVRFLIELFLLALLLPFQCSGLRSLPLSSLSCSSQRHARCSLSSRALLPLARCSSSVMLSMRNKTAQPRVSFAVHAHYVPFRQMDTQTNGHTVRRTSAERTNVGLAHARPQLYTALQLTQGLRLSISHCYYNGIVAMVHGVCALESSRNTLLENV